MTLAVHAHDLLAIAISLLIIGAAVHGIVKIVGEIKESKRRKL